MRASSSTRPLLQSGLVTVLAVLVGICTPTAAPARPAEPAAAAPVVTRAPAPAPAGTEPSRSAGRAAAAPAPGGWTGFAFDACRAPSQRAMDRWRAGSPFLGVGVYIGGALRACAQRHLSRRWVARQLRSGWRLLPLWVGRQASCTGFRRRIDAHPGTRGRYPGARRQGVAAAHGAAAAAHTLGIPAGTTLWYDIEPFSTRGTRCRRSALRFLSSWTLTLHRQGFRAGVYSTLDAAVAALAHAPGRGPRGYAGPDHVWFAWANHRADSWFGRHGPAAADWRAHRRVHQYALDVSARYGGVRLQIDRSFVDLGHSVSDGHAPGPCGRAADRRWYPALDRDATGPWVGTAQCLLRFAGVDGAVAETGFGPFTRLAVRGFQRARRLPATGRTDARTWTALLASGTHPVVKRGSAGPPVRRVQRALNAALPGSIPVTGLFGPRTASAVRHYQQRVGAPATGVVAGATWDALTHGRLTRPHRAGPGRAHHRGHAAHRHRSRPGRPHHSGRPHHATRAPGPRHRGHAGHHPRHRSRSGHPGHPHRGHHRR